MKVEVGKYYMDGNGVVRYISRFNANSRIFPYACDTKHNIAFTENGSFLAFQNDKKSKYDLVKEITKDEYPEYYI